MGVWGSIRHAARKVAKKVKQVAKVVATTVKDTVEAITGAITAPIKDVARAIKHTFLGVVKVLSGDRKGAADEFAKAKEAAREITSDFYAGATGLALIVGVNYLSAIQRIIGVEAEDRRLTESERQILQPIFGDSVNYDAVRITEGKLGLLGATNSVFTICHKIRVAASSGWVPLAKHVHVLVHEITHVWQFEHGGPDYVPEALWAQATGENGYALDDAGNVQAAPPGYAFDVAVAAGEHWSDFNPEQQATFIEVAYQVPVDFTDPDRTGMPFNGIDYTNELKNALSSLRQGEGTP